MTRDRLSELKEKSGANGLGEDKDEPGEVDLSPRRGSIVVYMDRRNTLTPVEGSFMHDFFQEVEDAREDIEKIEKHVAEIRRLHSKVLTSPRPESIMQVELEDRMASIKSLSAKVRKTLQRIRKVIEEQEATQLWGTNTSNTSDMWTEAEFRIRRTQHSMLTRQFADALNDFANIRVEYRDKHKEWLRRQLRIVKREPTDDELEDIMEKGEVSIFTDNVLLDTLEARQTLAAVEARHEEIIRIEKSVRDLRDLFLEMALLVEQQGEIIDNIEHHVNQTNLFSKKAKRQIHQAKQLRSGVRRKKIIIIVLLVVVAVVVALIIYFTVSPVT